MNAWRWLGLAMFLVGAAFLIGNADYSLFAGDKKQPDDPKKTPVDPKKQPEDPKKTPVDPKKQPEVKKEEAKPGQAWKFAAFDKKDSKIYTKQYTETKQDIKVMGQTVQQNQKQTFILEWVTAADADKEYVVNQRIHGVHMEINIGGNKISYDSRNPQKQKNPMTDFFEKLTHKDSTLKFTIEKDLSKVKSVEGRDKFIGGLSEINPQMKSLLNAILSEKSLGKMAEPTWYAFPPGGVVPADKTWKKQSELDLGPIGKYTTNFTFKHVKTEGTKETIDITTTLDYVAPTEKSGLPFIIHEAKLTAKEGTGSTVFDTAKNRFESTKLTMKLEGTLKIEVGGMKTDVSLSQEQTSTSDTLDDLPADWKAK
jgi:hypothetical protein